MIMRRLRQTLQFLLMFGYLPYFSAAAPPQTVDDAKLYSVIANYLTVFPNYVHWPTGAMAPGEPIRIGVLGRDPFGTVLEQALEGKSAAGRPLVLVRAREAAALRECQLVFVDHPRQSVLADLVKAAEGRPMLTIVFATDLAGRAMVELVLTPEGNVRYAVNVELLRRADLTPSAGLLRSALRQKASE